MRFSTRLMPTESAATVPSPRRSSLTYRRPIRSRCRTDRREIETLRKRTSPADARRCPAIASASSRWPLPLTPATPRISPGRTCSETPRRPISPPRAATWRSSSSSRGSAGSPARGECPSTWSCSSTSSGSGAACWPNIIPTITACSSSWVRPPRSAGARRPATRPCLSTVTRSPMPVASWSLWVMRTTARPWAFSRPSAFASSVTPCGVSMDVGSSRISTFEPRQSALTISTCCCCPRLSDPASASASISMPSMPATSARRARDPRSSSRIARDRPSSGCRAR